MMSVLFFFSANAWGFSSIVDVNIRSGDDGLDDPLAIGALATASSFKCLARLRERETIKTLSTINIGWLFDS